MIGASSYLWRWKHVVYHHTYPNVDGQDTDIDPGRWPRLWPAPVPRRFHRWQHLYLWPAYALTASRWHLMGDFKDVHPRARSGRNPDPRSPEGEGSAPFLFGKVFFGRADCLVPADAIFNPWYVVVGFPFPPPSPASARGP